MGTEHHHIDNHPRGTGTATGTATGTDTDTA